MFRACSDRANLMDNQSRLRLKILLGLFVFFLLSNLSFFLVKVGGMILSVAGTIELITFIFVTIWFAKLISRIIKNSEWRNPANVLTVLTIPTAIILSGFYGLKADENTFQSEVKIRACYEGTMNTSTLYFRENGEFEDFNIGFFAHVNYVRGSWKMDGDTLVLTIESGQHNLLKERMIIKDNLLYAIEKGVIKPTFYHIGRCKGIN